MNNNIKDVKIIAVCILVIFLIIVGTVMPLYILEKLKTDSMPDYELYTAHTALLLSLIMPYYSQITNSKGQNPLENQLTPSYVGKKKYQIDYWYCSYLSTELLHSRQMVPLSLHFENGEYRTISIYKENKVNPILNVAYYDYDFNKEGEYTFFTELASQVLYKMDYVFDEEMHQLKYNILTDALAQDIHIAINEEAMVTFGFREPMNKFAFIEMYHNENAYPYIVSAQVGSWVEKQEVMLNMSFAYGANRINNSLAHKLGTSMRILNKEFFDYNSDNNDLSLKYAPIEIFDELIHIYSNQKAIANSFLNTALFGFYPEQYVNIELFQNYKIYGMSMRNINQTMLDKMLEDENIYIVDYTLASELRDASEAFFS